MSKLDLTYGRSVLIKSLLTGISLSAVTPMKSGDYGGRLIWIDKKDWPIVISALFWGNWCQLLWLMITGLCGLVYLTTKLANFNLPFKIELQIALGVVIILLIILWFYLRIELFTKLFAWLPFKDKMRSLYINYLQVKDKLDFFKTLIYAGLRYFTYVFQSMFLIYFLGSNTPFILLLCGVIVVFFIQSALPVLSWLGLIGRTGIAIFVLNKIGVSEINSSASSLMLWILNILLPSFFGVYYLFKKYLKGANEKQTLDRS